VISKILLLLFSTVGTQTSRWLLSFDLATQTEAGCDSPNFRKNSQLGEQQLQQGKALNAAAYLEKAHKSCPSDYPAGRSLIIAYDKAGEPVKARALAEQILRQRDVAEIHSLLGELASEQNDFRGAAEQYQLAARLDPSEDNIFDFGSSLLKFEGDSAVRIFRFGVEKYPNSEKMHLGLGGALYGQGLADEAVAEMRTASELNPSDPRPMELLGQMAHIPAAMSAEIIAKFSSLCALYPKNGRLAYYYAMALSGRWSDEPATESAQVMDLLKKATELDPGFAQAHFQLGEFYQEQGQALDALHSFQLAAKLDPRQESYHYRLALAYKKCGDSDQSSREMEIYQTLHDKAK
jgi:tetratricopeptide (TPR) repeat protein